MFFKKRNYIYLAATVYILWVIAFSVFDYMGSSKEYYSTIDSQLRTAAHTIPFILPSDLHHNAMSAEGVSKKDDLVTTKKLTKFAENNNITYLYSMIRHNNKVFFTSSSATDADLSENNGNGFYFYHYDDVDPKIYNAFDTKVPTYIDVTDQWGTFRSFVLPLQASDGSSYLVGADMSTEDIQAQLLHDLITTLIISILFLLFALPLLLSFTYESRRWAKELSISAKAANEANQAKTEFLANMSHELRTPMHAILSFSNLGIQKIDTVNREHFLKYFTNIKLSADRLLILLNNLLDLSMLESGKIKLHREESNLVAIFDSCLLEQKQSINKRGLTINRTQSSESVIAMLDRNKIAQVITNLLSNAIKFSPESGEIAILIELNNNHQCCFSIYDQGIGIPEDELQSIFIPFNQSSRTNTAAGGTGLGLSISKDIIALHNGSLSAENNPNGGACFKFVLPNLTS